MGGVRVLIAVDGSEGPMRALDAMTALVDLTVTETLWLPMEVD